MSKRSNRSNIIYGMFWKFGERIIAQGVSFVVSIILSRILLPSDYGIVALVLVFINIADVFVTSGFNTALVQNKDADDVDFSTNFYCCFVMSLIVYFVIFLVAPYIASFYSAPKLTLIIRVFAIRIPISSFNSIQHAYVERNMLFKRFFFSTLFGTVISGIIGIVLAICKFGVWALIAQYFINTVIDIIVLFITVPWRPKFVFSFFSAKKMIKFGWKVLVADLSGVFFDQLRSLLIGKIYSSSDLAYYNKGKQLPDLINVNVSSSLMTVLFPAISNVNDSFKKVKQISKKSLEVLSYVMFPLFIGLASIAKPLVLFLYTEKWSSAVIFIQILSIASMINISSSISLQAIKAVGRSDVILKMEYYKKPLYLVLLLLGLYRGTIYIAITMALYNIYESIINSYMLSKIINYSVKEQFLDIVKPLLLSIFMSAFIYPLSFIEGYPILIITLQLAIAITVYLGISALIKEESFLLLVSLIKKQKSDY